MVIPKTNLLVLSMLPIIIAILASFLALPVLAQGNELWPADYVLVVTVDKVIAPQGQAQLNGHLVSGAHLALSVDEALSQIPGKPCPEHIDAWWSVLDRAAYDRRSGGGGRCVVALTEWCFKAPEAGDKMIVSGTFDPPSRSFESTLQTRFKYSPAHRTEVINELAKQRAFLIQTISAPLGTDDAATWSLENKARAIDLLGEAHAKEAIPGLIDCLSDTRGLSGSDNWVGGHACNALRTITGKDFAGYGSQCI